MTGTIKTKASGAGFRLTIRNVNLIFLGVCNFTALCFRLTIRNVNANGKYLVNSVLSGFRLTIRNVNIVIS